MTDSAEHVQFEANIDDMDPRLWPSVLDALFDAGAQDAWLTPIIMKKGRPAHTLGALCQRDRATEVRDAIFANTTTIGLREFAVVKHALDRSLSAVTIHGHSIGVKVAAVEGEVVNTSVEWDDVMAASEALGLSPKVVLEAARAAAAASVD